MSINYKKSLSGIFLLFLSLSALFISCEPVETGIPDFPVYIKRNIDTNKLVNFGSYLYIEEREMESDRIGFGGIIVVKAYDGIYYAFDMTCTNEKNSTIHVGRPGGTLSCTCETCGEVYDLGFGLGVPTKGLSKLPLKRYNTYIDDYNYLIVTP